MSVKSAREALWRVLGEGEIKATGINPSGQPTLIPEHEWAYLAPAGKLTGDRDYLVMTSANINEPTHD
jgi:hypothetical protein